MLRKIRATSAWYASSATRMARSSLARASLVVCYFVGFREWLTLDLGCEPCRAASEGNITPWDDILAAYDRRVDEVAVFVSFLLDDDLNAGARMILVFPLPRPFAEPRHLVDCQLSLRHVTAPHRTRRSGYEVAGRGARPS